MSKIITIISGVDGTKIDTDEESAKNSVLIKTLIEEYENDTLTIPDIRGPVLNLVIEFLSYMKNHICSKIPKPLPVYDLKEFTTDWEFNFLSKFNDNVYDLLEFLMAVNYLDIDPLLELISAKVATLAKDFDREKFMEVFQIEEDMSDEELKKLEKDHQKKKEEEIEIKNVEELNNLNLDEKDPLGNL